MVLVVYITPVMYSDISGYVPELLKAIGIAIAAIVVVVAVTAVVTLTAGAAAYLILGAAAQSGIATVMIGAASGGIIAGSISIASQAMTMQDSSDFDFGTLAIDTFFGSSFGAISGFGGAGATLGTKIAVGLGKVGLSGITAGLHGINEGKTSTQICSDVGKNMIVTAGFQVALIGGGSLLGPSSSNGIINRVMNNTSLVSSSVVFGLGVFDYFIER